MIRTQIQLTDEQARALKRLAAERHQSVAELVRRGVEVLLRSISPVSPDERRRRAAAVVGRFRSGRTDLSGEHDRHLAEAYGK